MWKTIDDRIHIVIFYKKIIKEFLQDFEKKAFRFKEFRESFTISKGFKILTKEGQMLKWFKGQSKPTNNFYALQFNHNALQAKLQSGRRGHH
ncbi:hypothetical protein KKD19_05120 [Patescibacteria group bacterium]|nr:hypothetical protein [Patescibacteria group bacterium]